MKWHKYPLAIRYMAKLEGGISDEAVLYKMEIALRSGKLQGAARVAFINSSAHYAGEMRWMEAKRPYYDVYPSVVEAFLNIDLANVMCEHVRMPVPDLMVRFQVGHELPGGNDRLVRSFLMVSGRKQGDEAKLDNEREQLLSAII